MTSQDAPGQLGYVKTLKTAKVHYTRIEQCGTETMAESWMTNIYLQSDIVD